MLVWGFRQVFFERHILVIGLTATVWNKTIRSHTVTERVRHFHPSLFSFDLNGCAVTN